MRWLMQLLGLSKPPEERAVQSSPEARAIVEKAVAAMQRNRTPLCWDHHVMSACLSGGYALSPAHWKHFAACEHCRALCSAAYPNNELWDAVIAAANNMRDDGEAVTLDQLVPPDVAVQA